MSGGIRPAVVAGWRMSPARPALALLAVLVLNLGTLHSWGFYTRWAFLAVVASWFLSIAAMLGARHGEVTGARRMTVLAALVLHFTAIFSTGQWYAASNSGLLLPTVVAGSFAATIFAGVAGKAPADRQSET